MEVREEILEVFGAIKEQVESAVRSPVFTESLWHQDFRAALKVAIQMPREVDTRIADVREQERQVVASAARIADLMAAERKARRAPEPGAETQQ